MRQRQRAILLLALLGLLTGASAACQRQAARTRAVDPARNDVEAAVTAFLKTHGELCLGKSQWPIVVTEKDVEQRTNDALQMPVLEHVGLVTSAGTSTEPASGRSYNLSPRGRRFYLDRKPLATSGDLCAGKIELAKIIAVEPRAGTAGVQQVIVRYTYHFAAAEWVRDPGVKSVFPMLARILAGERAAAMELRMQHTQTGWVALDPRA